MKRIFTLLTAGVVFIACHNDTKAPEAPKVVLNQQDTVGLAALKAAKAEAAARQAVATAPVAPQKDTVVVVKEVPKTVTKTRTVYKKTPSGSYSSNGNYTAKAPATVQKKKGWSKAAKGTAIGAGTGAVIGAIAGKGKGAIIGGVVGGAAGYGIGRHKDKKDGRVQ